MTLGWEPIVDMLSFRDIFHEKYDEADEKNVIRFMVTDTTHPGSIINTLAAARENARIVREIIPSEAWELINNLHHSAKQDGQSVLTRRHRFDCLNRIVTGNQTITGLLDGVMNRDKRYAFLSLGRHLERADMTTRIIDVRSASLLPELDDKKSPFENIQWMSVLKSLTAYQMYRQEMRLRIRRPDILNFLMKKETFPRSVSYSLQQLDKWTSRLPNTTLVSEHIHALQRDLANMDTQHLEQEALHCFIDDLQLGLVAIHDAVDKNYF